MRTATPTTEARGVIASLVASILFGLIFYVSGTVDASAEWVFGWRILLTAACYAALLASRRGRRGLADLRATLRSARWRPVLLVCSSVLVGAQLWLFVWTPVHGHALDASLGYLLLPIALVLVGRFVFRTPVSRVQWAAVLVAAGAVAVKVASAAAVSWVTVAIALGYAAYFLLRRRAGLDAPAAFGAEVALLCPAAVVLVLTSEGATTAGGQAAVLGAALAGAVAMSAYLAASRLLTMPVFGLLSYVEPVLLVGVALLLGDEIGGTDVAVYGLLAVALALLAVDGFRGVRPRPDVTPGTGQPDAGRSRPVGTGSR